MGRPANQGRKMLGGGFCLGFFCWGGGGGVWGEGWKKKQSKDLGLVQRKKVDIKGRKFHRKQQPKINRKGGAQDTEWPKNRKRPNGRSQRPSCAGAEMQLRQV